MIDPKDLNKGNYVFGKKVDGHVNELYEVLEKFESGVAYSHFSAEHTDRGIYIKQEIDTKNLMPYTWLEPVPLFEDWLGKFGAIAPFHDAKTRIGSLQFIHTEIGLIVCDGNWEPASGQHLIRYVHQLQNSYFEKTGEYLKRTDIQTE
jgi:hypothetical protein